LVVEGAVSSEILVVWLGGLERFRLIGLPITEGGGEGLVGQGGEGHDCTAAGTGTWVKRSMAR